ncbi:hypothetical protein [Pedobacter alluvionis]|uniref:DUF3945 domain-containing protein n=1 Tax=Pedobacter alluvionis TaxID=475253 RepID=A0A497Y5A3_9SPHI|nr:hypothetical protein [Pedobacter alluvionis]RLJ77350.1 hypothetical protein BCL90_2435 [Pedobacter alluvionis]TFB33428.1 hypothetical protein E3V97_05115 [Pedobacter alluvionis]
MSTINLNNLEDRKADMKDLGANEESIKKMEESMRLGLLDFTIRESKAVANGQVDITFPFRRSEQSDNYYMSRFTAQYHKIKPLEEGHSYFVITPKGEGKNDIKKFDHPIDAIEQFKKREGNAELATGKDVAHKTTLASMEKGEVNFVARDFRGAFYGKPIEQTFFPEQGKGFSVPQAANLVQGRSVYRDDMVDGSGIKYKAWFNLDIDSGKTGMNFRMTSQRDPAYGFDLSKVLSDYNIKGIDKPEYKEQLEATLKQGDRTRVIVNNGTKNQELDIETAVRFKKVNFFKPDGSPERREQFLSKPAQANLLDKDKAKEKDLAQGQEIGR